MAAAPPDYETATSAANTGVRDTVPLNPESTPQNTPQKPAPAKHIFPPAFGFYHASGSSSDMCIAFSNDAAYSNPLFYISTHGSFSSQPSVVLFSSGRQGSPPLADARFHSFSSTIDITLYSAGKAILSTTLEREGAFSSAHSFSVPTPSGHQRFEWKSSSGAEVVSLQGGHRGRKL
ncbi:hypothetical protein LSUE1_G010353, partial [Lachnellula suecica]